MCLSHHTTKYLVLASGFGAGLVQVSLYAYVFWESRLYSDFGVQIVYIGLQFYGWYQWLYRGPKKQELPVIRLSRQGARIWLVVAIFGIAGLGTAMHQWTNADLPYWDAAIAVFSLIAQYLLAWKVLENWLIWIVVDSLGIGVFFVKELYPTVVLSAIFLIQCIYGYRQWKKTLRVLPEPV